MVSATKRATLPHNTPGVNYVVERKEIEAVRPSSASDVMDYVLGLDVEAGTGVGSPAKKTVSINGTPSFHNIVLVDGKRLLSSHFHTGTDINLVPTDNIERIEVVKDASCALYGSDAIGGVINIITRSGSAATRLNFNSSFGTESTLRSNLSIAGSVGDSVRFSAFAGWDQSDGLPLETTSARADRLNYRQFSLMDRFDIHATDRVAIGASTHYVTQNDLQGRQGDSAGYDAWLFTPGLDLNARLTRSLSLSCLAYYSQWHFDLSAEKNEIASSQFWLSHTGLKNNVITFGGDQAWRNFSRTGVAEKAQTYIAAFIQDEFTPFPALRLLGAVRSDYVFNRSAGAVNTGPVITPKLSLLYRPLARVGIRAGWGLGFRAPTVQDLFESRSHRIESVAAWRLGNSDLKPEFSTTINAGLEVNPLQGAAVLAHGYYYRLRDMIAPVASGRDTTYISGGVPMIVPIYERENIDDYTIGTFEMGGRYRISHFTVETGGSASWQQSSDPDSRSILAFPGQNAYGKVLVDYPLNDRIAVTGFLGLRASFNRTSTGGTVLNDYKDLEAGIGGKLLGRYELFVKGENLLGEPIDVFEDALYTIRGIPRFQGGIRMSVF